MHHMNVYPLNIILPDTESGHEILEKVFQCSSDGIAIVDTGSEKILAANPSMIDMLAYKLDELNSLNISDLYPDEMVEFRKFAKKVDEKGGGHTVELSCKTKDGQSLCVEVSASSIKYNDMKCMLLITRDVTEGKELKESLRQALDDIKTLSLQDELTKLNNRRGLYMLGEQQLKIARRMDSDVTVFFGDLDNLKYINDTFGHAAGDQALIMVADVLRTCFRETDILARIGGDEFVVISFGCNLDVTRTLVDRIQNELDNIGEVIELPYPVYISFGAACQDLDGTFDLDLLIKLADDRMYKIKSKRNKPETK